MKHNLEAKIFILRPVPHRSNARRTQGNSIKDLKDENENKNKNTIWECEIPNGCVWLLKLCMNCNLDLKWTYVTLNLSIVRADNRLVRLEKLPRHLNDITERRATVHSICFHPSLRRPLHQHQGDGAEVKCLIPFYPVFLMLTLTTSRLFLLTMCRIKRLWLSWQWGDVL